MVPLNFQTNPPAFSGAKQEDYDMAKTTMKFKTEIEQLLHLITH